MNAVSTLASPAPSVAVENANAGLCPSAQEESETKGKKKKSKRKKGCTVLHDSIFHRPDERQVGTLYGSRAAGNKNRWLSVLAQRRGSDGAFALRLRHPQRSQSSVWLVS